MIGRALALCLFASLLPLGCAEPVFGEMPALCSSTDGACPEGYDCIHGVCALPGTPVPVTVAELPNLRGSDLRLVPQTSGVLIAWETYAYSEEGQRFVGARVTREGAVSPRMDLVRFVADSDTLEPYFDALAVNDQSLLVAIASASLPDDPSVMPRLVTYRVDLPPIGQENASPSYESAWPAEERLDTVGYGAVSVPALLSRGDHVELGYVRSRATSTQTLAELVVFSLGNDGAMLDSMPTLHTARADLPVAVGVLGAFAFGGGAWWVLDDERPSVVLAQDAGGEAEVKLGTLAIPVSADQAGLTYLEPSQRSGDKLETNPVSGPAKLLRVAAPVIGSPDPPAVSTIGELPTLRDTPRPAWVKREGKPSILVTPGADVDAKEISVWLVDPASGSVTIAAKIPRLSSRTIGAVKAAIVGGDLFVAWLETVEDSATIRLAVVPEP